MGVQVKLIRKTQDGKCTYLFEDKETIKEFQDYHITKLGRKQHQHHEETLQKTKELLKSIGGSSCCYIR